MHNTFPIHRSLLMSLLMNYIAVMALHGLQLPVWMMAFAVFVGIWRINILRAVWVPPKTPTIILMTLLGVALLYQEYQQWFSIEPMLTLLLLALSLKLLEIRQRRDAVLSVLLSYFTIACSFLFNQSVLHSLASGAVVLINTALLLQLHTSPKHQRNDGVTTVCESTLTSVLLTPALVLAGKMLLQSVVLAGAMMLVLPRLNPLWSVPLHSDQGLVGMSDSMSPGDIGQLIQNNALAFRATILDESPSDLNKSISRDQLYWRGLVFDQFDGRRWQRSTPVNDTVKHIAAIPAGDFLAQRESFRESLRGQVSERINYEILMEPTGQHWLYGMPVGVITDNAQPLIYTSHYEILQKQAVNQRIKYRARTYPRGIRGNPQQLSTIEYRRYTALPINSNPRTQQQALQWWQQSGGDETRYIASVFNFMRQNITYTLSPPTLGRHTSDEFLFQSQKGFCEHFSSSFAVLMRSVGIPSRVVVGYQGGEWSRDNSYLSVFQRDAHAWNEVWLEGQGWIRFDPTAAVAAMRIQQGVRAALPQVERGLVGRNTSSYQWIKALQLQWQVLDYRWQQWVLDYDTDKQQSLLSDIFGDVSTFKMALIVLGVLAFTATLIALSSFGHLWKRNTPEKRMYQQLQKKLKKLGVEPKAGETIGQYCQRGEEAVPEKKRTISTVRKLFEQLFYGSQKERTKIHSLLAKELRKI